MIKKPISLNDELAVLNFSYNVTKTKMQSSKEHRTYGMMAKGFGVEVLNGHFNKSIWFNDLDIFKQQREQILKDKYASKRFIDYSRIEETKELPIHSKEVSKRLDNRETICIDNLRGYSDNRTNSNSTWKATYPNQKAILIEDLCNQPLAAQTLWDNLSLNDWRGQLLRAPPGIGKTYILGSVIKNFIEQGYINKLKCISPWPIIYITKATVVDQTKAVLKEDFGIDTVNTVHVVNIELLRTKFGKNFVKDVVKVENGESYIDFEWNEWLIPCLIIWDESQGIARADAMQTRIANAVNNVKRIVYQIDASATPFSRVIETKHFTCSTRIKWDFGGDEPEFITNNNFSDFARQIASPHDPEVYSEFAIKQYMDFIGERIVEVKDIKLKYKSFITTKRLHFKTQEESDKYQKAWAHYQEKKAKIESDESLSEGQSRFMQLAQFTIFRQTCEEIRAPHIAEFVVDTWNAGEAPAVAFAFKRTGTAVYRILVEQYGWKREDVSFIWGGATESLNAKAKLAKKIKDAGLSEKLEGLGISMEDLGIDIAEIHEKTNEQYEFEKLHNLLTQKPEHRESERLRFQRQDSRCLMYSYKSGGVGLSAHHERKYINARPRRGIFTPIYSEKEITQGLARLPRITSISDTYSVIAYYGNTIEDDVLARVIMKLKCARHVSRGSDSWIDVVTGNRSIEDVPDLDSIEVETEQEESDGIEQVFIEERK